MASLLFVALQWVCVICNQKQSVTKELRFFVQSFHMARKVTDEEEQVVADTFSEVDVGGEIEEEVRGIKRPDWSEYLDDSDLPNGDRRLTEEEEDVTRCEKKAGNELFKPFSSRCSIKNPEIHTNGEMMMKGYISESLLDR